MTSTEYLLGLRAEAPPDLAKFAAMSHGPGGHSAHTAQAADHHAHTSEGTHPVRSTVPIRMTSALDSHAVLAAILVDRTRAISSDGLAITVTPQAIIPDDRLVGWIRDSTVRPFSAEARR